MNKLTNNQIIYITKDLRSKGLSKGFRTEILDHLCCLVEKKLDNQKTFKEAYHESLEEFGNQGFQELKKTSPILIKKRKTMLSQLSMAFIAAVFTFSTFNFIKPTAPSIHPIGQEVEITSSFGLRLDPIQKVKKRHTGIDFRSETGTPVKATGNGVIIEASTSTPYGNKVIIKHDDEYQTMYAHMHELHVIEGQNITKGQVIGTVGNTGRSTSSHLHYEVIKNGIHVDPIDYLKPTEEE